LWLVSPTLFFSLALNGQKFVILCGLDSESEPGFIGDNVGDIKPTVFIKVFPPIV